jgi:hypothetical protein
VDHLFYFGWLSADETWVCISIRIRIQVGQAGRQRQRDRLTKTDKHRYNVIYVIVMLLGYTLVTHQNMSFLELNSLNLENLPLRSTWILTIHGVYYV